MASNRRPPQISRQKSFPSQPRPASWEHEMLRAALFLHSKKEEAEAAAESSATGVKPGAKDADTKEAGSESGAKPLE